MNSVTSHAGLAGVSAGSTAICTVGMPNAGLTYRGYSIEDLAANAHPMDVLRTGCSALGCMEPETQHAQQTHIAERLLATLPGMLCYWHHFHRDGRRHTCDSDAPSIAAHFLYLLDRREAASQFSRALDVSLILYSEHEFNASTFAARVCGSTLSDFYSVISTAIGTLRGSLHGGVNEAAMEMIDSMATPNIAEQMILQRLSNREKIIGFGHRVYKTADPRIDRLRSRMTEVKPKPSKFISPSGTCDVAAKRFHY